MKDLAKEVETNTKDMLKKYPPNKKNAMALRQAAIEMKMQAERILDKITRH